MEAPLILDNALERGHLLDDNYKRRLMPLKNITRRYIFNKDASHKVGRFAVQCADIVCRQTELAITPYPNTYIEIDNVANLDGEGNTAAPDTMPRLGYWFTEHGQCFTCAGDDKKAYFMPFVYAQIGSIGAPFKNKIEFYGEDKVGQYEEFKELLMVGQVAEHLDHYKFAHCMTDIYEVGLTNDGLPDELLKLSFDECIGDFKRALACLLLLDARIQRQVIHVDATRKIVKGKLKAYAPHAFVTIDLDVPSIRKVYDHSIGHHESPIRHEVSGHWVHYNISTQCKHEWTVFHSDVAEKHDLDAHGFPLKRFICKHCGGRRTRKLPYEKGDASKGSRVGQEKYKVIASKEKFKG